jgi:hypothetical protein
MGVSEPFAVASVGEAQLSFRTSRMGRNSMRPLETSDGTGAAAGRQRIRMTYSQFVTPSVQGLISFSHDVSATGQFQQNFGVLLRVAKLF